LAGADAEFHDTGQKFHGIKRKIRPDAAEGESVSEKQLLRFLDAGVPLLESFNAAGGIHVLLLAGKERVTLRTDADAHVFARGPGLDDVATRAVKHRRTVFRMNLFLHVREGGNLAERAAPCKRNHSSFFTTSVAL
jgi:hypothetical protein